VLATYSTVVVMLDPNGYVFKVGGKVDLTIRTVDYD
jgi:hypothetical protein